MDKRVGTCRMSSNGSEEAARRQSGSTFAMHCGPCFPASTLPNLAGCRSKRQANQPGDLLNLPHARQSQRGMELWASALMSRPTIGLALWLANPGAAAVLLRFTALVLETLSDDGEGERPPVHKRPSVSISHCGHKAAPEIKLSEVAPYENHLTRGRHVSGS